jgi:alpha-glucosidase
LESSSLPDSAPAVGGASDTAFTWLGDLTGAARIPRGVAFTSGAARIEITALAPNVVRVRLAPDGVMLPRRPWAVDRPAEEWPETPLTLDERDEGFALDTGQVRVRVARRPLRVRFEDREGAVFAADDPVRGCGWRKGEPAGDTAKAVPPRPVICWKTLPDGEHYYGLGERTGLLDKRGVRYTNWTTDVWNHGPSTDAMYHAIPFVLALRPAIGLAYGLYCNTTFRSVFDLGDTDPERYSLEADGGELDYYLLYGPTPAEVVRGYTALTGRMALPPRWALGYHQSRWSYASEHEVRAVAAGFRRHRIPADVIHLDIDYMDGFRDFTWNAQTFPHPGRLMADLRQQGFRVVPIVDPGIKNEPGAPVYEAGVAHEHFLRDAEGALCHAQVWPGDCVFPDFTRAATRAWWGELHRGLLEAGASGIWNDMNEPAMHGGEIPLSAPAGDDTRPATFAEVRNVYALEEARATAQALRQIHPDERPFVLTRAGFAGIQRYSAMWTGDNTSTWEHLEMALPQLSNLGLSGMAFCGTDIGGFFGNATPELFARWIEMGALFPFARGHSHLDSRRHEPWAFGSEVTAIARRYLELRYRLLPYLYTLFEEAAATGAPLWRPLIYAYPTDPAVIALHDEILLGADLLLAPVYRPGVTVRQVYFPTGAWHDFWTGERFVGPRHALVLAPLETLPLYAREGSIIPSGPTMQYSDERLFEHLTLEVSVGEKTITGPVVVEESSEVLTLDVYLGEETTAAEGQLYEDDGHTLAYQRGEYRRTRYRCERGAAGSSITATVEGPYMPGPRRLSLRIHGVPVSAARLGERAWSIYASAAAHAHRATV